MANFESPQEPNTKTDHTTVKFHGSMKTYSNLSLEFVIVQCHNLKSLQNELVHIGV